MIVKGVCSINAPKHVVIAGFNPDQDIGSSLNFGLNGSIRLESDRRTSTQALIVVGGNRFPNPLDIQDCNAKINFRAAVGNQNGAWRIEFWDNNIFDVEARSVTANTPLRGCAINPGAPASSLPETVYVCQAI
jgi:iron complex outermembrane recepter protein